MAGILQSAAEAPPAKSDERKAQPMADDEVSIPEGEGDDNALPGQEPASPEEEEALRKGVAVAMKAMSAKGAFDRLLSSAKTMGLSKAIAQTTVGLVEQVDRKLDMPETTIMAFTQEVVGMCFEAATRAKMAKPDDENALAEAMNATFQQLSTVYEIDPQEAAQLIKEMEAGDGTA